jgi:hypothetical protein
MTTFITATEMTSTTTEATAAAVDGGGWEASWLPGRILTHGQAVTAMTIAEAVHAGQTRPGGQLHGHLQGWAAELGLTADEATALVTEVTAK